MDHVGDMAHYIQRGLNAIGYDGLVGWDLEDPQTLERVKAHDEYVYDEETGALVMHGVWGKDWWFKVTIEEYPMPGGRSVR